MLAIMVVRWSRRKYTQQEFIAAVESSTSWRGVARSLGVNPDAGGIYHTLKITAKELGLGVEHFSGQGHGTTTHIAQEKNRLPLDEILVEESTYLSTSSLKKRLIKEGLLVKMCYAPHCPLSNPSTHPFTGESVELKLALDHINGNRFDNRLDNLRLLCYHCHGLTETYCGKNKPSRDRPSGEPVDLGSASRNYSVAGSTPVPCTCGKQKSKGSKQCRECSNRSRARTTKIDWPPLEELEAMVKESSYLAVGRKLGVSDNAIRKAIKRMKTPY